VSGVKRRLRRALTARQGQVFRLAMLDVFEYLAASKIVLQLDGSMRVNTGLSGFAL
jgi:hypothetical protein